MNWNANLDNPLEIVRVMAEYGHFGAGGDATPEQQLFGAQCLCAAILVAEAHGAQQDEIGVMKAWEREHRALAEEMRRREDED